VAVGGKAGPPLKPWREICSPFAGFTFSADGKRYTPAAPDEFAITALNVTFYSALEKRRDRRDSDY
jgi:hypothetical protein